jgi:hypothetical protein
LQFFELQNSRYEFCKFRIKSDYENEIRIFAVKESAAWGDTIRRYLFTRMSYNIRRIRTKRATLIIFPGAHRRRWTVTAVGRAAALVISGGGETADGVR